MHHLLRLPLLWLLWCLCGLTAWAGSYTVESLPAVNDRISYVSNPDGILRPATVDSLNTMLLALDRHEVQCLVVCVSRIDGGDAYDFAIGLGRRFGVGGKKNLGIVLVLATDDRAYQITTGQGMEKYLPDAICSRIGYRVMLPYLKNEDWDAAMLAALRSIKGYLDNEPEITSQLRDNSSTSDQEVGAALLALLLGGILLLVGVALAAHYNEMRCPRCRRHKLKVVLRRASTDAQGNVHSFLTYRCKHCQHQFTRERIYPRDRDRNGGGGFIILGGPGSFGGSSHSGGFGGGGFGGFGGGGFGGGGAGGHF